MEDRREGGFSDVRAIGTGTSVNVVSGEADLIVDDQMHGSAGTVAPELRHLQHLIDDALSGDGGVSVNENGHKLAGIALVAMLDLGAGDALDNRVDSLQV